MSTFELTAKHQMYLGPNNIVSKGEHLTMNIHTMGVQPTNIFSNPESRRQAIQQFAVNGIELKPNSPLLNIGNWDVKKLDNNNYFNKTSDNYSFNPFGEIKLPWNDSPNEMIDDVEMKKGCIDLVSNFYGKNLDLVYSEKGLEGRCEMALGFYDCVKKEMGIDADLQFVPMPPNSLGSYNHDRNCITLNSSYLENSDCGELLNTILHESRHAFQHKCIDNPDSVTVKNNIIDVWKDNCDNYISPQEDFEAYENQEIEKDANYFADSVMKKGTDFING